MSCALYWRRTIPLHNLTAVQGVCPEVGVSLKPHCEARGLLPNAPLRHGHQRLRYLLHQLDVLLHVRTRRVTYMSFLGTFVRFPAFIVGHFQRDLHRIL